MKSSILNTEEYLFHLGDSESKACKEIYGQLTLRTNSKECFKTLFRVFRLTRKHVAAIRNEWREARGRCAREVIDRKHAFLRECVKGEHCRIGGK